MQPSERQNTLVCSFEPTSPRITAYQIHEWIHENMHLQEEDVRMIQIDGPQRKIYITAPLEMKGGNQSGVSTISVGWLQYIRRGTASPKERRRRIRIY
jgi:hypothetical protein